PHLPAVFPHACELPARADGGHVEPVHRARHPQRRRKHGGDPVRQSEGHRLSLSVVDAAQLDDDAPEHDRLPWRKNGAGDAVDLHADDPAPDGLETPLLTAPMNAPTDFTE